MSHAGGIADNEPYEEENINDLEEDEQFELENLEENPPSYYSREPWNDEDNGDDGCEGSKVAFWMMRNIPQFGGAIGEDPVRHEQTFHAICYYIKPEDEPLEEFQLRYFKFSLTDSADDWFYSSGANYERSYWGLRARFLEEFTPPSFRIGVRVKLRNFKQFRGELFYEYSARFEDLRESCPHHGFPELFLMQRFLEGMMPHTRNMLDAAAGGSVMNVGMYDLWNLIYDVEERSRQRHAQMHKMDNKAQTMEADSVQIVRDTALAVINEPGAENEENKSEAVSITPEEELNEDSTSVQNTDTSPITARTSEELVQNTETSAELIQETSAGCTDAVNETLISDPYLLFPMQVIAPADHTMDKDELEGRLEAKHELEKPTMEYSLVTVQKEPPEECKTSETLTVTRGVDSYVLQIGDDRPALILERTFIPTTKKRVGICLMSPDGKKPNFHADRSYMKKRPRLGTFEWKPGWRDVRAPFDEGYKLHKGVQKFNLEQPWDPNL